ncbi:hypothetical protein [Niveibacterium terrae]|uniref:hypothetical protein n=1 Tax=Niveibacterium terrae TaxID=3373598 RepID=UPI003A8F6CCF
MKPASLSCLPMFPEALFSRLVGRTANSGKSRLLWPLLLALLVLCLSSLTGCAISRPQTNTPEKASPAQTHIAGKWQVENSSAVFEIASAGDGIAISGLDSSDGEAFVITNVKWDGQTLEADFLMPSTDFSTHSRLSLADKDTLTGKYADGSPEIWRRIR